MKTEKPAEGILKRNDWGDSKTYQVVCDCGQPDHDHNVWVEADETGITVQTFVTAKTDYWTEAVKKDYNINSIWLQEFDWFWKDLVNGFVTRVKLTWTLWTKGYIEVETSLCMSKQQALNYASVLQSSVKDVEEFRKDRTRKNDIQNKIASKLANETDCV